MIICYAMGRFCDIAARRDYGKRMISTSNKVLSNKQFSRILALLENNDPTTEFDPSAAVSETGGSFDTASSTYDEQDMLSMEHVIQHSMEDMLSKELPSMEDELQSIPPSEMSDDVKADNVASNLDELSNLMEKAYATYKQNEPASSAETAGFGGIPKLPDLNNVSEKKRGRDMKSTSKSCTPTPDQGASKKLKPESSNILQNSVKSFSSLLSNKMKHDLEEKVARDKKKKEEMTKMESRNQLANSDKTSTNEISNGLLHMDIDNVSNQKKQEIADKFNVSKLKLLTIVTKVLDSFNNDEFSFFVDATDEVVWKDTTIDSIYTTGIGSGSSSSSSSKSGHGASSHRNYDSFHLMKKKSTSFYKKFCHYQNRPIKDDHLAMVFDAQLVLNHFQKELSRFCFQPPVKTTGGEPENRYDMLHELDKMCSKVSMLLNPRKLPIKKGEYMTAMKARKFLGSATATGTFDERGPVVRKVLNMVAECYRKYEARSRPSMEFQDTMIDLEYNKLLQLSNKILLLQFC